MAQIKKSCYLVNTDVNGKKHYFCGWFRGSLITTTNHDNTTFVPKLFESKSKALSALRAIKDSDYGNTSFKIEYELD